MLNAAQRTSEWREDRRKEGWQHLDVWIPGRVKNILTNLATQRRQHISAVVTEAILALPHAKAAGSVGVLTPAQVREMIQEQLAAALASQPTAVVPQAAPQPEPEPPADPLPPLLPGWKKCTTPEHPPYDGSHYDECPIHARERKQRYKENKAKKKQGEVPSLA
jgi:hypothetical protein